MSNTHSDLLPVAVIAGATASGKSSIALELAEKLNGEIISVDSMQLYKDIPIGTAQPTAAERLAVPHHLVGIYDLDVRAEVYTFVEMATAAVRDITSRGRLPILCGGTGLYLKALLYGLDNLPGDEKLKKELDIEYDSPEKLAALQARLQSLGDAAVVEKFSNNRRRLIRALEIRLLTGRSIIELQGEYTPQLRFDLISGNAIRLEHDRAVLQNRIALRTKEMLKNGWIDEARAAIAKGLLTSPTAHQALGYKIINRYLNNDIDLDGLEQLIVTATWQYARRQQTWFRHQHPELEVRALS